MKRIVVFSTLLLAILVALVWYSRSERHMPPQAFRMTVENVFYIKNLDRVIVTGMVSYGSVKPGDPLVVAHLGDRLQVTAEKLENPHKVLTVATKGDDVGIMLRGIRKDQVTSGDLVLGGEP